MTRVAWREDDFEERHIDPYMLASGAANASIMENEHCLASGRGVPDIICIGPDGRIIAVETKLYSNPSQTAVVLLDSWNRHWFHGKNLILQPHIYLDTGVALSRASIDEPSPQVGPNESISGAYADFHKDNEYLNIAAHPLTRSAYEQLAGVPDPYKQAIVLVLNQFVTSLPKRETTSLPSIRLTALDDLSYLLEWTFEDRRLGFSFEANPKESGWYFVLSTASSERYESGTMDQLEMSRLIRMMMWKP